MSPETSGLFLVLKLVIPKLCGLLIFNTENALTSNILNHKHDLIYKL